MSDLRKSSSTNLRRETCSSRYYMKCLPSQGTLGECGGSMMLEGRDELLRLSADSNQRALADAGSRGYESITDDPKYEDFFVGD
jgi:hypothetical protein